MPILSIRHVTTYHYNQPVAFGEHRMMLRPRDDGNQKVLESERRITDVSEASVVSSGRPDPLPCGFLFGPSPPGVLWDDSWVSCHNQNRHVEITAINSRIGGHPFRQFSPSPSLAVILQAVVCDD